MSQVLLGENSKLSASKNERSRIREFYRDVLGCEIVEKEVVDIIQLGPTFHIGVRYEEPTLTAEQMMKAMWLELRVERPDAMKKAILDFGIREIDFWDKEHFYFQAPGGQVFRLAGSAEDMSKWKS